MNLCRENYYREMILLVEFYTRDLIFLKENVTIRMEERQQELKLNFEDWFAADSCSRLSFLFLFTFERATLEETGLISTCDFLYAMLDFGKITFFQGKFLTQNSSDKCSCFWLCMLWLMKVSEIKLINVVSTSFKVCLISCHKIKLHVIGKWLNEIKVPLSVMF